MVVSLYVYKYGKTDISNILISEFKTRVANNGGTFEADNCLKNLFENLGGFVGEDVIAQRLELFQDEKISVTSSLQNSNDLGKIFTDYSQSFTIPASKSNNEILSHWYESSIDNGYDHRIRYDAYIEIDTHRFKNGNIQLEKASKKDGFIENYSITFYGNLTQLKDKFKDTKLRDLSTGNLKDVIGADNYWDAYAHTFNSTEVRNRILNSPQSYVVKYPLIGSSKKYYYKNGIATEDITLTTSPVVWNELFPAVSMPLVFSIIQQAFGITFIGSFFSLQQWDKLYLYLKNAEKLIVRTLALTLKPTSVSGSFPEWNASTGILTTNWDTSGGTYRRINGMITPNNATIKYIIYVYKNGILFSTREDKGTKIFLIDQHYKVDEPNNSTYEVRISFEETTTYNCKIDYQILNGFGFIRLVNAVSTSAVSTISKIQLSNYVPDITVNDFVTGIIKAFNLLIIPISKDKYEFVPLETFYNQGKILDITEYCYSEELEIERPKLYKSINFEYEKSENILNNGYRNIYNSEYGNLSYKDNNSNESTNYEIKLPFENVLFERTVGENFMTASIINKDLNTYIPKPMLIYLNGNETLSTPVQFKTETGFNNFSSYQRFSNELNAIPTDLTFDYLMTMNFNNEQSPWYNVVAPQGLYYRHYKNFIDNLYNIKTRVLKIKAVLPTSLLGSTVLNSSLKPIGIALNDRLIIRNKRYIINNFTTELTSGETTFELITDYRSVNAASSIGYKFASYQVVKVNASAQDLKEVIYLNDYDYFIINNTLGFLKYVTNGLPKIQDTTLDIGISYNDTGVDRTDEVAIDYYLNGILSVTEKILFLQEADYLLTENFEIIETENNEPITLN